MYPGMHLLVAGEIILEPFFLCDDFNEIFVDWLRNHLALIEVSFVPLWSTRKSGPN